MSTISEIFVHSFLTVVIGDQTRGSSDDTRGCWANIRTFTYFLLAWLSTTFHSMDRAGRLLYFLLHNSMMCVKTSPFMLSGRSEYRSPTLCLLFCFPVIWKLSLFPLKSLLFSSISIQSLSCCGCFDSDQWLLNVYAWFIGTRTLNFRVLLVTVLHQTNYYCWYTFDVKRKVTQEWTDADVMNNFFWVE